MLEKLYENVRLLNSTLKRNDFDCKVLVVEDYEKDINLVLQRQGNEIIVYHGDLENAVNAVLIIHNFVLSVCILGMSLKIYGGE